MSANYPAFGQRDMDRIALALPEPMKVAPFWLCWAAGKPDPKKNGRFPKVPYYANGCKRRGEQGSAEDRSSLVDFLTAASAAMKRRRSGVGFAVLPGCGIVAGDFDELLAKGERTVPPELAERIGDTYTELSPSGTGIRCFWSTPPGGDARSWKDHATGVEIFADTGFVTVTGEALTPCADLADAPGWALRRPEYAAPESPSPGPATDDERRQLIADIRGALAVLASDDRAVWVKYAHVLHPLGDDGYALWDEWSQKSTKYDAGAARYVWGSVDDTRVRATYKTIFKDAKAAGWKNPAKRRRWQKVQTEWRSPPDSSLPLVRIAGGELAPICDDIEKHAVAAAAPIYQRGGVLVAVIRRSTASAATFRRAVSTPQICVLTAHALRDRIQRYVCFEKFSEKCEEFVPCDLPELHTRTLLDRSAWRFPVLAGIIAAPTLRPDGTVLDVEGYDRETGLLVDFAGAQALPIPASPPRGAAVEALTRLQRQFSTFPFMAEVDRDAYIAAIITALLRPCLRSSPAFGLTAPTKGTGKTLLASLVGIIATGRDPAMGTLPDDEDEARKQVLSLLIEGDSVIVLDNINSLLKSACLEAVLTAETFSGRLLGASRTVKVPAAALWLMTGNNLAVGGDMARRILPIHLDAETERPWERQFEGDIRADVTARRAELVRDGLIVGRAYAAAGRPSVSAVQAGGFEDWARAVRDAIVWAGGRDAYAGARVWDGGDPETINAAALLRAWHGVVGTRPIAVKHLVEAAKEDEQLKSAIEECATDRRGAFNTRTLGRFLRRHERQVVGGYRLVATGEIDAGRLWSVAPLQG